MMEVQSENINISFCEKMSKKSFPPFSGRPLSRSHPASQMMKALPCPTDGGVAVVMVNKPNVPDSS